MTIRATFNTAVHALNAQSQALTNISTNIANVNTNAYKVQNTHFQTLVNHTKYAGQKFLSVDTVDSRQVDNQGIIRNTQRKLDLAINGRGFFVTNPAQDGSGTWAFSRDGEFFGESVQLVDDSDGDGQLDQGSLLKTGNGNYVYGWQADENGVFGEENDLGALVPVSINSNEIFPSKATENMSLQANVSAETSGRQSVGLPFVDASGQTRTLTIGFTANTDNSWTMDYASTGTDFQPVSVTSSIGTVEFNSVGKLISPSDGLIDLTVNDATGPQAITLDISKVTQYKDAGQIFVQTSDHDGFLEGRLKETYFTEDGVLVGSYTNAELRNLFKLPIATFTAPNNLEAIQGNAFGQTIEAGEMKLNALNKGSNVAEIFVAGLETSDVDLADQFSKMIITQRAYSSSATVLRTADEMTMQARDLKR